MSFDSVFHCCLQGGNHKFLPGGPDHCAKNNPIQYLLENFYMRLRPCLSSKWRRLQRVLNTKTYSPSSHDSLLRFHGNKRGSAGSAETVPLKQVSFDKLPIALTVNCSQTPLRPHNRSLSSVHTSTEHEARNTDRIFIREHVRARSYFHAAGMRKCWEFHCANVLRACCVLRVRAPCKSLSGLSPLFRLPSVRISPQWGIWSLDL